LVALDLVGSIKLRRRLSKPKVPTQDYLIAPMHKSAVRNGNASESSFRWPGKAT